MTSIISFVLCLIIIGILYKNMIAWEGEYRISRAQALVSVFLGLVTRLSMKLAPEDRILVW